MIVSALIDSRRQWERIQSVLPGVVDGDIAELIGDASPLRAGEVAARCGTIPNELLSRLGARLPVVIK